MSLNTLVSFSRDLLPAQFTDALVLQHIGSHHAIGEWSLRLDKDHVGHGHKDNHNALLDVLLRTSKTLSVW